ncbi:thiamine phosphate synthase [Chelatococcus sp. SYSU_G07232]|uniref:Thiamine phosphate synthase n=1 Tax=Chelatococcus albus TaxID=3047466 RepID=A0ABT7ABW7_9HYPH|nr:thiamine phosphate synthase [Chelatococcus sp. SYSU_G07232]MDJ1156844.1 thiamine phosphate synthase [Chelatococcus sp. SYSU_G07232]
MRLPHPPLLLITDRSQARGGLLDLAEAAFAAGCRWMSLREKDLPASEQAGLLAHLMLLGRPFGARVTLHGDPLLARAAHADGVHLPAGADPAPARLALGRSALVGLSVHRPEEAAAVDPRLVDYVIAAPAFATASKPGYGPALGPEGLSAMVAASPVPVVALGGIDAANAPLCRAAGAAGIAVMGGVMRAIDPGAETAAAIAAWRAAAGKRQPRGR